MASVFARVINKDLPGYIVAEEPTHVAFLDVRPLTVGHTLVVPRKEVDNIFDLEELSFAELMLFAKRVAMGIQQSISCLRVGMAVVGLEVPHAHIHLVPLNDLYDIDFQKPRLQLSESIFNETAKQLKAAIAVA